MHRAPVWILAAALLGTASAADVPSAPPHIFRADEGRNINSFVRVDSVAAHLLLRSGHDPRVLVAFPAGDSAVGLWFSQSERAVGWTLVMEPRVTTLLDGKGRRLNGIVAEVIADARQLRVKQAVLSSVRVLRDYEAVGAFPAEVAVAPIAASNSLTWSRDRLDGAAGYLLIVQALNGDKISSEVLSARRTQLHLRITAATGEKPLTPLDSSQILTSAAVPDARARDVLRFLTYREKYLAGSWRFNTYFGRDTLMSIALLMPVLQPEAIESGLSSILERLSDSGEVAHEEDVGEYAILRNMKAGLGTRDDAIFDYGMIDDDFMLAPVAAAWFLDKDPGRGRLVTFLATRAARGQRTGDLLVRNFRWVLEHSANFALHPTPENLIGIQTGRRAGQWRDSDTGLGGGRYPYDVNAALVPAALRAIDRFLVSGALDPYLSQSDRETLERARAQFQIWSQAAPPLFDVMLTSQSARNAITRYAANVGVPSGVALSSIADHAVRFSALALDTEGEPTRIMHSDEGFLLLFGSPSPSELDRAISSVLQPFPAGLWTPIGILVANPAYAGAELQSQFTRDAYHGTVVWSWQQALLVAGLNRQLARADLPAGLRARLKEARLRVWTAIEGTFERRTSELWSWSFVLGCYRAEAFGLRGSHADESNAAQLWSTVFLALPRPPRASLRALDAPCPSPPGRNAEAQGAAR